MIRSIQCLIAFSILVFPQICSAMLIAECADMKYVKAQAAKIVRGEVIDVQYKKEGPGQTFTFITIRVDQYVRGDGPETITLKQFGGTFEENGQTYTISDSDSPDYKIGDKGTLYLTQPDMPFYAGEFFSTVCSTGIVPD